MDDRHFLGSALSDSGPSSHRVHGAACAPRAMTRADVPAVAALFCKVFREGEKSRCAEVEAYLTSFFFGSPSYDADLGSLVQEDAHGKIVAIMGSVPLPIQACGHTITARLMSAFMCDPDAPAGSAGRIAALTRAKRQDFAFSSSGAPLSADATRAGGGQVLPLQSLEWVRPFRPLRMLVSARLEPKSRRRSAFAALLPVVHALLGPVEALSRRLIAGIAAGDAAGWHLKVVPRDVVLNEAPAMVERFAVRPQWHRADLNWQLDMAAQRDADGPLKECGVFTPEGELAGLVFYYARPDGIAQVLNILTRPRQEAAVVRALLAHLDAAGYLGARGEAQPFLMPALSQERGVAYRFSGNFCVLTRHEDIAAAVARGDFYSGGLVGESWSRLVSDFW